MKSQGFLINPYDRYITNRTIKDKQYTISWYFDDNKVSCVDEEIEKVIGMIAGHFCNLIVSRGKKHKLLGMDIYF